ncbi:hypothetical protein NAPIS_ORF01785 [Vairimorpha apis BRL 01]|uniref:Uncharacterized protein n=1 Tax=Vairimorpha apis BRL 01 TaxID=1037528 RepID=T0L842_9MICR|nr:hypothetical protein NAPIS_ORF01785 [Vairimorpha apis BRL 01]
MTDKYKLKLKLKKQELTNKFKLKLKEILNEIPLSIRHLPLITILDALKQDNDCDTIQIIDKTKAQKRQSIVCLNFGEQIKYDGKVFTDSKGKTKNDSLDSDLKALLKDAKRLADRYGRDLSLFKNEI